MKIEKRIANHVLNGFGALSYQSGTEIFSHQRNILQLSQVLPFTSHACMEIGTHSTTNVCFINDSATQGHAEL